MEQEPLAAQMRPNTLEDFVGQYHLVGEGKPLRAAIEQQHRFSFILWGPPGSGKTTLARIYAAALGAQFFEHSAVSAGKTQIKHVLNTDTGGAPKVLFLDEIHRFNKTQQDFLLPYVERGDITLIGATTENPSFEVIPALLSRCRVFTLYALTEEEVDTIVQRTGVSMDTDARAELTALAAGDARQALTVLENTQALYNEVTVQTIRDSLQERRLRYDKHGEEHYNTVSAFIKSMRAGQPDAAMYYLARMIEAGEDPKFIARRMVIFASEDIGLAQPTALVVANEVFRAVETIGLPEAGINLAHGVAYLTQAQKDRRAYDAYTAAVADVHKYGNLEVPYMIRNASTRLMQDIGYGAGYEMYTKEDLMPEELHGRSYFSSKGSKTEKSNADDPSDTSSA